jgi:uncharacterized protein YndB with AHSA1/START domain
MSAQPAFDRAIQLECRLPHPPEAVYAAFADPARLALWWGPRGFRNTFHSFDFRPGGDWHFTMHGPDGTDYANHNRFEVLEPGRRLAIRHVGAPHFTLTVTLSAEAGGTHLAWDAVFDDPNVLVAVRSYAEPGGAQNLERLAAHLGEIRP